MLRKLCFILVLVILSVSVCFADEYPVIAVSFLPIDIFAQNVLAGTNAQIILLAPSANGCLHDYQMLPGDLSRLQSVDILFINGAGMENFLDDIRDIYEDLPIIDLSEGVSLLTDEKEDPEINSHIWLSPINAITMVNNMADKLAEVDSTHAQLYRDNADAYINRLEELHHFLESRCAKLLRKDMITFHEAFPYFARDYGLTVLDVIALEPDEGISPKRLAYLTDLIRKNNNPPLFIEAQYPSDAAIALANETGAEIYELNTVTSGSAGPEAYEEALIENMYTLEKAMGTSEENHP